MRSSQRPKTIKKGLEELGHATRLQAEWQWMREGQRVRPGLRQLRPEDLPPGVSAARGYDHRGHCTIFAHETLGELGKIVLINIHEGKMLLQAELCKGQDSEESPLVKQKKHIPPNLVVKSQPTDIVDIILQLIRLPNGVYRTCRNKKSRGELLSTAEVQWFTTKSDGMWNIS